MKFLLIYLLLIIFSFSLFSQTDEQRLQLKGFAREAEQEWKEKRLEAESLAVKFGLSIQVSDPWGSGTELQRFENGIPLYYITHNLNAAKTISTNMVWPDGGYGFNLSGTTESIGIWDYGQAFTEHQELTGRIQLMDTASVIKHGHATHVSGTLIASGLNSLARGMSFQGYLHAYEWDNDISEMALAAANGLRVSNHSYGIKAGWTTDKDPITYYLYLRWYGDIKISPTEDYRFGFYSNEARDMDYISYYSPNYLIVRSAGNHRGESPPSQPIHHQYWDEEEGWIWSYAIRQKDGGEDGYESVAGAAVAKNVLVVGAVEDVITGYTNPADIQMTNFSSWGPTDDGRIKPDIVANGVDLFSCYIPEINSYFPLTGTSMSAPNVTGSIGLLLQHQKNLYGDKPLLASTLKALIIHTADSPDEIPGPDYQHGWGLMNTLKAVQLMNNNFAHYGDHIKEMEIHQGEVIELYVKSTGIEPLQATICWTDPPGNPPISQLNPSDIMLVNDLDMVIMGKSQTFQPFVLDPSHPSNPPFTADNDRDNVEQIYIENPGKNLYTIKIFHEGPLSGDFQKFSLIMTGLQMKTVAVNQLLKGSQNSFGQVGHWEGGTEFRSYDVPKNFEFAIGSTHILRGDQNLMNFHKYYQWNEDPNVQNHHVFEIQDGTNELISIFDSVRNGIIIKNDLAGVTGGTIEFKDPWLIDYPDPDYGYTKRNRGMKESGPDALIFKTRSSPFNPDYETVYNGDVYQGVFLNQDYNIPNNPYYSVRALPQQVISFHEQSITWYFQGWQGNPDSVAFEYPTQDSTAVVFKQDGAVAKAVYKGHLVSTSIVSRQVILYIRRSYCS